MDRERINKQVAIVVLNWNGVELLREFVPQWVATTPEYAELIIADNGSTDTSLDYLRENHPAIKRIELEQNYGFAEGYNRAIAMLEHPFIVLLNSDATPCDRHWLEAPLGHFHAQPNIVAVQPKICSYRSPRLFEYAGAAGGFLDILGYPYCRGRVLDKIEEDKGQYDTAIEISWASGACLIIRRKIYQELGGLDATFFAHQEEIDLCWRIRARGGRIVCEPRSKVLHLGGASLDMNSPKKAYLNHRNNLLMLYKNLPNPRLIATLLVRIPLDLILSLLYLIQGKRTLSQAVVTALRDAWKMHKTFRKARRENLRLSIRPPSSMLRSRSIFCLKGITYQEIDQKR